MRRQRGYGLWSWLLILCLVGVAAIAGLRIAPIYIDYYTVVKIVNNVYTDDDLNRQSPRELHGLLNKRFRTNNLWDMKSEDTVEIRRDREHGMLMRVKYEIRSPLIYNLDVIASFDREIGAL